ncbi:Cof-type HAD-IIB family hydrolase [Cytobacillus sp. FJAT-54145]|uniref:Cof-type HAD-IIB family hydrolase n=1 Tax=Cytobacillus spartinae TaxID=3299023 RepID=A0ABW6K937_9BACI
MTSQKMIFFDIDGTLLDEEKQLPISTKQAITRLKELGHLVAIATGRSPFNLYKLMDELELDTYVSFNGQYVVIEGNVIYKNPLDSTTLRALTEYSLDQKHPLIYMDHEDMRSNYESHPHVDEAIGSLKVDHPVTFDPHFYKDREIYQSLLFCTDDHQESYRREFSQFDFIRWHQFSTDVLPQGGSKAKGIEEAIRHLGIKDENVYAFGDGLNDIEMLKYVHNSVAMGNAPELVKNTAKYVTKHVDNDGILHGLELVGLLK